MPLKLRKCFDHRRVWWNDESFHSKFNGSVWEPQTGAGEFYFNHIAAAGHQHCLRFSLVGWSGVDDAMAKPVGFKLVWDDQGANSKIFSSKSPVHRSLWRPVPPEGYGVFGMLGLGREWHSRNRGVQPSPEDFPKFRCVKLEYLVCLEQTMLQYEWRWNDIGSGSKRHVSLYNAKFLQPGLKEIVHVCVGELGARSFPSCDMHCFDKDMVSFDEKSGEDETPEEKLAQNLGKAKAVCSGNFWRYHNLWKHYHFILFSDYRLEYYKDNSGTSKGRHNPHSTLELRGSYQLSAVASLKPEAPQVARTSSLRALKKFIVQPPTPHIIDLKVVQGKSAKFAFESKEQMKIWLDQLKMFSIFVKSEATDTLSLSDSRVQRYSGFNLGLATRGSMEDDCKSVVSDKSVTRSAGALASDKVTTQTSVNSKWDRRVFWIKVINRGMKFSVIENTCVETLWNLYVTSTKDWVGKIELSVLLSDWMRVRIDNKHEVEKTEGIDFLDNVSERALKGKRFLNVSRNGRVIFQEFKSIRKPGFWQLMDERIPIYVQNEAREMWKRILKQLAEFGFLGDDEVFEIWERYDSTETGKLTLKDIQVFLQDWINSIGKLYPDAVKRDAQDSFIETIEIRAEIASQFLDPNSTGITFKLFQKIQEVEFWQHVDYMVSVEIPSPSISTVEVKDISDFITSRPKREASVPRQRLSWSYHRQQEIEVGDEEYFEFPSSSKLPSPRNSSPRYHTPIRMSDVDLNEDPSLARRLNNLIEPLDDPS